MEEYIRIVNDKGITKIYYKRENGKEEFLFHKLNDGESARVCIGNDGKLASINEKYLNSKDCLSCSNSFSEPGKDGDILHCIEQDGKVVKDDGYCDKWN